ncbi:MAG: ABC transporter permease [Chloroflexi bacterium]|nr:ABC transporter permease [Chloroflexota bacterium]
MSGVPNVAAPVTRSAIPTAASRSFGQRLRIFLRGLSRNPSALVGGIVFLAIALSGIFASVISPYDPIAQNTAIRLQDASPAHLLGTDHFGRDIFTRILFGSQTILLVAIVSIAFSLTVGTTLGIIAGYHGGRLETWIMRTMDVMLSFPLVLLAIIIVVVLGPGVINLILAIGISQVPLFTRLSRSLALSVRARDFVLAAICLGASSARILGQHIFPNIIAPLVVQATTTMALAILNATALNFLGFGIQPPSPDWGAMVSDFRRFVFDRPHLPLYPGVAIAVTVLCLNLLGDGLIDLVDPTARKNLA